MKKRGFTLIELLAVIVILAIVALIATPIILGIINNVRKASQERSAELYLSGVELAVVKRNLTEEFNPSECTILSGKVTCNINEVETELEVEVDGDVPTNGTIKFENNKVTNGTKLQFSDFKIEIKEDGKVELDSTSKEENDGPGSTLASGSAIIDLGYIDMDEYDGEYDVFLGTLTDTGTYKFIDSYDEFTWYVFVYNMDNTIGQTYFYEEEGYYQQYHRSGYYDSEEEVYIWDDWYTYLNSDQIDDLRDEMSNTYASKSHTHVVGFSPSTDIRTWLDSICTNNGSLYLRNDGIIVTPTQDGHTYRLKLDYRSIIENNKVKYYKKYQEYYDIEEPEKLYKRTGTYDNSTKKCTWGNWYVFSGVEE